MGLLVVVGPASAVVAGLTVQLAPAGRGMDRLAQLGALPVAAVALMLVGVALANPSAATGGHWYLVDARGAAFLAVSAVVGAVSVSLSPAYLRATRRRVFSPAHRPPLYHR